MTLSDVLAALGVVLNGIPQALLAANDHFIGLLVALVVKYIFIFIG